jgi:hypothetical protein
MLVSITCKHQSLQMFRTLALQVEFNPMCSTKTNIIGKYAELCYDRYLQLHPYKKHHSTLTNKNKPHGLSPQANYTD